MSVLLGVAHAESGWQSHKGYNANGGWGLMNLTDVTGTMLSGGDAGTAGRGDLTSMADHPELHTLQAAAKLTGASAQDLKNNARDNISGGAALLASYQKQLTGGLSSKPADWTGAIAKYSQLSDNKAASRFVDNVFSTIRSGTKAGTQDGTVQLSAVPSARPDTAQLSKLKLKNTASPLAECPSTMNCQFVPAAASNGQVSDRPANGVKISEIVIHTTEGSYQAAIDTFQTPGGSSAQYVMRSSDGAVTQMVPNKDVAFGDGNYWSNLHSVQIEHEGFSAQGADWYTDAAYRETATLVKYLADRFDIPLDRQHIVGHDNVPAPSTSGIAGMHWDPGYAWDWARFMRLLGAPFDSGTHGVGRVGSAVTIAPAFTKNQQTYTVCPADDPAGGGTECREITAPSNSLFVRSAPSSDAPLILDPVVHPGETAGTNQVSDWSDTVQAGQHFVVADRQGDWTAIWFGGQKGWINNPHGRNTVPAEGVRIIKAAGTAAAPVYGTAYPDANEYPEGLSPSSQTPLTATNYAVPAGQSYVADQEPAVSDDYFASSGTVVKGAKTYYTIQFNHRYVQVNSTDVTASNVN
ncbi:N-acetylmuramoyl-L-alanine amidase [Streptomyces sp. AcH 505]|uniref:N-acetylmuramoyl-L-alanine amidase n=1 Tax=Streptomyces sp. AcH 505 TaxID=352211 RepID=UPI001F524A82